MKSKLITVFVATALSTLGLCSTISHASDKEFLIESINSTSSSHITSVKFVKANVNSNTPYNVNSVELVLNKPMFNLTSPFKPEYIPTKAFKKNELYELATLFNDKLQQFLALFDFTTAAKQDSYFHSDRPNDNTTIDLSSDCNSSKT
jgi:hypothetical protein